MGWVRFIFRFINKLIKMAVEQEIQKVEQRVMSVEDQLFNISQQITTLQTALTSETEVVLQSLPYTIGTGHNMFGFTGSNGIDTTEQFIAALGGGQEALNIMSRIRICKDQSGQFWIPDLFNGLGSLVNGRGYYLYNEGDPFVVNWI